MRVGKCVCVCVCVCLCVLCAHNIHTHALTHISLSTIHYHGDAKLFTQYICYHGNGQNLDIGFFNVTG